VLASWVQKYLNEIGVLINERTVDIDKYPTLAAVETRLVKDFGRPPVMSVGQGGDGFGMSTHYIGKGGQGSSWS
jgi:hypothetical protein